MRNLRSQKEIISLATAAAAGVLASKHIIETNPTVFTNAATSFPTFSNRLDLFPPYSFRKSVTNIAHCDSIPRQISQAGKIGSYNYPANNPCEDFHIHGSSESWTFGAVFDGHGGPQVAKFASENLLPIILTKLKATDVRDETKLDASIVGAFEDMEKIIVDRIRGAFQMGFPDAARVGSCVLVALKKANQLIIANCGDCRAVLGSTEQIIYQNSQTSSELRIYPTRINRDHNCRVPLEQLNLQQAHPNEPNLIVCKNSRACYVKGRLQLTRSLGDAYLKYAEFNTPTLMGKSGHSRFIPDPYTPPYVSHQPDIHHLKLEKEDKFVILGSDGLWDYLSDQEAVDIVFKSMKNNETEGMVAERLVTRALEIAASESGLTLPELKKIPQGRSRRNTHDDTTAVVIYF